MIVGVVTQTGLGLTMANSLVYLSGENLLVHTLLYNDRFASSLEWDRRQQQTM